MSDWAKETAQRLRTTGQSNLQDQQDSGDDLRILKFRAPRLWVELKESIELRCQNMGRAVVEFRLSPPSGLRVKKIAPPSVLTVDFNKGPYRVSYSCGGRRDEYRIGVDANGSASFRDAYHRWFTVEEVAEKLLDLLVQAPF